MVGGTLERHGGGKGANQAVAAARRGQVQVHGGRLERMISGEQALAELEQENVDVTGVVRLRLRWAPGWRQSWSTTAGENQIAVASGANAELDGQTAVERGPGRR